MALIKCSECGREISDKASACIHCGCPISQSKPQFDMNMFAPFFTNGGRRPQKAAPVPAVPPATAERVRQFKARRRRVFTIPVSCLFIAVLSILVTAITEIPYLIIPFVLTFLPGIWGIVKLFGVIFGDKVSRSQAHLEERGLLAQLVGEMDNGPKVAFGDKALLSDHFLFMSNGKSILLSCDDILWVYTRRGNRYENLMLGTRHLGVVTISGQDASLVGALGHYKEKLIASIRELQRRCPGLLVGDTPENRAKYKALREN